MAITQKELDKIIDNCEECQDPQGYNHGSHYHCARCGEVTGMYGHYQMNSDKFSCEEKDKDNESVDRAE